MPHPGYFVLHIQIIHSGLARSLEGPPPAPPKGGPYAPPTPEVVTSALGPAVQALFVGAICGDRIVGKFKFVGTEL